MDVAGFLSRLQGEAWYRGQIVHWERLSPRAAAYAQLHWPIQERLELAFERRGTYPLYGHQVTAIKAVLDGSHVMVPTGAASGKSLCYHIPILETALQETAGRSLYLAPTKALAQD